MIKPLLLVVAVGAGIGLMLPSERPSPAAPAPPAGEDQPRETLLERRGNGHFYVDAKVNGQIVNFVVDTGATDVALTVKDARALGLRFDPDEFEPIGRGASGLVYGKEIKLDTIEIDGKRVSKVSGVIAKDLHVSLLGQSYLARISTVQMNGDYMSLR